MYATYDCHPDPTATPACARTQRVTHQNPSLSYLYIHVIIEEIDDHTHIKKIMEEDKPERTGWTLLSKMVKANRRESLLTLSSTASLEEKTYPN